MQIAVCDDEKETRDMLAAFGVGAFHYLVKPFHNAKFAEVFLCREAV